MKASVVVVTHTGVSVIEDSLPSLHAYCGRPDTEVVLVDNGSGCGDAVRSRFPDARVVASERNLGFAGGVALGAEAACGDVLLLLNDDAAAAPGWVEAHLDTLERFPEAAVSAGRLTSWDGARHDFVRGVVTFDVHAFQVGQGLPVAELEAPALGEPLPFACGGNMAIRLDDWQRSGGFDPELFAYFEDVDLGWRLWACGRPVVAAPNAVARHRGGATSSRLGNFRRGVLFERNALRTFFACADLEHRQALGPAVLATFLHRLVAFAQEDPQLQSLAADPFAGAAQPLRRGERWRRRVREQGWLAAIRHLLGRLMLGPRAGLPTLDDGYLLMQLRAAHGFFAGLDNTNARRVDLDARRAVPDRDLVARFSRLVVPTYSGDEQWFASDAFQALLPDGWELRHSSLEEVVHRPKV